MEPEQMIFNILTHSGLPALLERVRGQPDELGGIYIGTPDFNSQNSLTLEELAPWIRITNLPGDTAEYSDNERFMEAYRIQIDFWIDKTKLPELHQIKQNLYKVMHDARWERYNVTSTIDYDNKNLRMETAYFIYGQFAEN